MRDWQAKNVSPETLTSSRVLAKNTLWNLFGQIIPSLVGLAVIPFLIQGLGMERFGVLMLALMFIGYFSLFDLGLGRALTKLVAERLGAERPEEIPKIVLTALALIGGLSVLGAIVLGWIAPWLVYSVLKIPRFLWSEALGSFYIIAVSIPIVTGTAGMCGVLEAYQRFDLINAVRIPLGLFTFLSPLLVLPFSQSLIAILAVLMAGRIIAAIACLWFCLRVMPTLDKISGQRSALRTLVSFGGWMTVTNLISPVMVYMDRFFVGAFVSMVAVAYYTTPYEAAMKLTMIPESLVGVLFPAFSTCLVQDRNRAMMLFDRGFTYIFLALFPLVLLLITLSEEGLQLWLGFEFAQNSTKVLQWLAVGVFLNSLARIPYSALQAEGRPDITAKLHLCELPIYVLVLWWLLGAFGIEGAAIAWVLRVAFDMFLLFVMSYRLGLVTAVSIRRLGAMLSMGLLVLALSSMASGLLVKTMSLLFTLAFFFAATWCLILDPKERHLIKGKLKILCALNR